MTLNSINPTTGEPFATYEEWQPDEVQDVGGKVHTSTSLGAAPASNRARRSCARRPTCCKNSRDCGRLITQEMGKPIRDSIAELQQCALSCDFYADNADLSPIMQS
jgi:succinate-semialdehyde dehydrogenase/glutarate-semialdehyde dehydrogenase